MILVMCCDCHNSDGLARKLLRDAGDEQYLTRPVYRGKTNSIEAIKKNITGDNSVYVENIVHYILNSARYAIVIGYDNEHLVWRDFSNGKMQPRLDAEIIVNSYK